MRGHNQFFAFAAVAAIVTVLDSAQAQQPKPTITGLNPPKLVLAPGKTGTLKVLGDHFQKVSRVEIAGVSVPFKAAGQTLVLTVSPGQGSGYVVVTTENGTAQSPEPVTIVTQ